MRALTVLGLLLACAPAGAAAPDLAGVVACMRANLPEAVRVQTIELTAFDSAGAGRVLKGRVFGRRERERAQVMARIESPPDLSGAAYLVREAEPRDEVYIYLPSVNRVKRVAGGGSGRLWGTDFSPAEFALVQNAFDASTLRLIGSGELQGRAVHRLALTPRPEPGEAPPYDAVSLLVDQDSCVLLQAEFSRSGVVRKRLSVPAAQLQTAGGRWYPGEALLEDLKERTRTRLRVVGVRYEEKLAARFFHPQQFASAY